MKHRLLMKKIQMGIKNLEHIDAGVKSTLLKLVDTNKLGIFSTPFKHQVQSLEGFSQGKGSVCIDRYWLW